MGLRVPLAVGAPLPEGDSVAFCVAERVAVSEGLSVSLGVAVPDAVGAPLGDFVVVTEGLHVCV